VIPDDLHEWVSFEDDEEDRTWSFDVTFLLSSWTCIFGRGCQGVLTGPAPELVQGCCSYGAHFTDTEDAERVEAIAATLTDKEWQFRSKGRKGVTKVNKDGETVTRMAEDACIFLNRPGFPAGPGCALHQVALKRGERPLDLKPNVCWQLPLRREDTTADDGHVTSTVTQWERKHWGDGGAEFHWWCTEEPEAFVGHKPVYKEMADELDELVGAKVMKKVRDYLDEKAKLMKRKAAGQPVAHPTVRKK
jgi:hypothetical protein